MHLELTPRAAAAVQARAAQAEVPGWVLRVAVVAGGCNGLTYELFFVSEAGPEDTVIESNGVKLAVDRRSAPLLDGTVIDLPGPASAGFRFDNPRARKSCGCGASFEV